MFKRPFEGEPARVSISFNGLGRTKQAHKDECDVNLIVRRFEKTGVLAHAAAQQAQYGDFSPVDYREALDTVIAAERAFADLPAKVRQRFNNDPGEFLAAAENPDMRDEFIKLGLIDEAPKGVELPPGQIDAGGGLASPQGAQ